MFDKGSERERPTIIDRKCPIYSIRRRHGKHVRLTTSSRLAKTNTFRKSIFRIAVYRTYDDLSPVPKRASLQGHCPSRLYIQERIEKLKQQRFRLLREGSINTMARYVHVIQVHFPDSYSHPFALLDDFFALCLIFASFRRAFSAFSSSRTCSFCCSDGSFFSDRVAANDTSSRS
jgi:hypothetical protein